MMIRHGDVVLVKVKNILPKNANPMKSDARGVVLAEGEATGHAHTIGDSAVATLFSIEGVSDFRLLQVTAPAILTHQEHQDVILDPGMYRVSIKRQYTEDDKGWAEIVD